MFLSMGKNIGYQNETQKQNTGHHPIRPQLIGYWFSFHPFLNGDMMHLLCQSRIYTALFFGIQLKQIFYSGYLHSLPYRCKFTDFFVPDRCCIE